MEVSTCMQSCFFNVEIHASCKKLFAHANNYTYDEIRLLTGIIIIIIIIMWLDQHLVSGKNVFVIFA